MSTESKMFQVSTLQALALGYNKAVITVNELLRHGTIGLGTFEGVDGEMIVLDGVCYRADDTGRVEPAPLEAGVPFASVTDWTEHRSVDLGSCPNIEELKNRLNVLIEEHFGLNSMHVVRIDGLYEKVSARSETGRLTHHITLKDALAESQKEFLFESTEGTMVCVYYPDFMDGINAPGWHLHFLSRDRRLGGHAFGLSLVSGTARIDRITRIEIQIPSDPSFDTYALKEAQQSDIKKVEQGD